MPIDNRVDASLPYYVIRDVGAVFQRRYRGVNEGRDVGSYALTAAPCQFPEPEGGGSASTSIISVDTKMAT